MLALVGTVFARRNQPEFVTAMTEIRADDFGRGVDPARGFSGLPEPVRSHAYLVSNFFDDMGKLIAHKVMKEDIIIGTYGQAGLYAWQALQPYVEGQRVLNRSNFQIYFEYLSKRVVARPPDSIHRKLKIL